MAMQRQQMVDDILLGDSSISAICRKYGISRPTAYKWYQRYLAGCSMEELSRAPKNRPRRTEPEIEALILKERGEHDDWGARKLKARLERDKGFVFPAHSTIHSILQRNNQISPEATQAAIPYKRFVRQKPNELWQCDFKGYFTLLNKQRCYPLVILDDHSRFNLCLEALSGESYDLVVPVFVQLFSEYGVPEALLSDNGNPWGNRSSSRGHTRFDVFLMDNDVLPIHTRFSHPQTQGKVERINRTMEKALIKRYGPFRDFADANYHFDMFRKEYNTIRPHQALNFVTPADVYRSSERKMPLHHKEWEYPEGYKVFKVCYGRFRLDGKSPFLSEGLNGQRVGVSHSNKSDTLLIHYRNFLVAEYDLHQKVFVTKRIRRVNKDKD